MSPYVFRKSKTLDATLASLIATIGLAAPTFAQSQQATDLGTVGSTANSDGRAPARAATAAAVAPTQSSLQATQPQSIINRTFFEESKSPASDFSSLAVIAPSVTIGISPNGPGLSETKNGLRGFKDGEFNITFDGIPFGDTNGPTHHSTAYFPSEVIGRVEVERGPGNASNIGQATFGGSINLFSRELAREKTISPVFAFGSWNTQLVGARFDSGAMSQLGDAMLGLNYQNLSSDGYRTYSAVNGQNFMVKFQKPIGDSTLLTANINFNKNWYSQNDKEKGLTLAQADALGKNYALSNDPTKANFYAYNNVQKTTAMNYVRLQSDLGNGWGIDNNAYYYNYTNNGLSSTATDLTVGLGSVKNSAGATIAGQMPGYVKTNEYRVAGNIFKGTKQTEAGLARAGIWIERADTHRSLYDFNLLTGLPNFDQAVVPGQYAAINNVSYDQNSGWKTYQPFVEFEWQVTPKLKVTPGLKHMQTDLTIEAAVNQTARIEQHLKKTFTANLPFLTANYTLSPGWSTYAQYARGMLVPDISSYQSANADASNIEPQRSTNYQFGIVHQQDKLTFDADIYYIDFNNKIATVPGTAAQPIFFNQGGVVYKGIEGQATYVLGSGYSIYANGSLNRAAITDTGLQIAGVPNSTSALGMLYRSGPLAATLFYKRVGTTYALDDQAFAVNAYTTTDLNISYKFDNPGTMLRSLKLQLGIYNLANKQGVITASPTNKTAGTALYGMPSPTDTFLWQPPRSMMASIRAEF